MSDLEQVDHVVLSGEDKSKLKILVYLVHDNVCRSEVHFTHAVKNIAVGLDYLEVEPRSCQGRIRCR